MLSFLRRGDPVPLSSLGPLEFRILETVWSLAKDPTSGVLARDVLDAAGTPLLAYTTVTTTLDRLCKKNLLERAKIDRAFSYRVRFTRVQLDALEAQRALHNLAGSGQLVSCLIDTLGQYDSALLDELEKKIRDHKRDGLKKGGRA